MRVTRTRRAFAKRSGYPGELGIVWFCGFLLILSDVSLLCCDAFMHPNSYGGSMSGAAKDGRWILNSSLPYKNQQNVALSGKINSEVKKKEMEPQFDSTILNYESSDGNSNNLMIRDEPVEDTNVELATTKSLSKKTFLKNPQYLIAIGLFTTIPIMASTGLLGGSDYNIGNMNLIFHDLGTSVFLTAASLAFVKSITYLVQKGLLEPRDSRKIIHTCAAPLFMLLWPLFSNATGVRYFAAITPFIQVVKLWLAGKGGKEGEEKNLANAISRSGDAEEALGGPFIYVVILLCSTLGFWTNSLVGIMAMSVMSIGDGLADLIGRRFGKNNKWFFAQNKSVAGSLAFVVGSTLGSVSLLSWLSFTNTVTLPVGMLALSARILLICSICAIIELFPFVDDNWSVPIAAAVLTSLLLS